MLWMEILRIRTSKTTTDALQERAKAFEEEIVKTEGLIDCIVFHHATMASEFIILLQWNTACTKCEGSSLAYLLAEDLSAVGMVDHSIWLSQIKRNER